MDNRGSAGTQDGTRVVAGRYTLLSPLGSGGMGTVWRALDGVLRREVALKEVSFPPGVSPHDRELLQERTRREARAAARLHHPSAVTVYDVVEDGGVPFIVMELVQASTLAEVVREHGPLAPQRVAEVGLAVLGALDAAHRQGIVHRDVKPSNVLLCDSSDPTSSGRVVLTDFGIATSSDDSSITSTGMLLGSPAYIAPERARGEQPGPASDLWSLGATLFTAVEGRPPFDGESALLTVAAVVTGEHAPFVAAGPLEPLLEGLLERDPARRLDAAGARNTLQEVVRSPASAPAPQTAPLEQGSDDRTAVLSVGAVRREVEAPRAEQAHADEPEQVVAAGPPWVPQPSMRPARPVAPRRRVRLLPAVVVAVLLLVSVLAGALALGRDGNSTTTAAPGASTEGGTDDGTGDGAGQDAAVDPGVGREPAPTGDRPTAQEQEPVAAPDEPAQEAASGPVPPPEGWESFTGGPGWQVAVPPSYVARSFSGSPEYRDPSTGRTVRVSTTGPGGGKDDAVQDRREQAASFERRYPDYREIAIERIDYRGYEAADWEFTYSSGGTALHALSRVFVVDRRGYSLFFQTRASDDWDAARGEFERIARSFRPA